MRRTDDPTPGATVDLLLDDAEVLHDTYDERDTEAARRRRAAPPTDGTDGTDGTDAPGGTAVPHRFPSAHEQAAHDLNLAVALVLNAPEAAGALTRLVDQDRIDPEGAVVFAALLQLTGHHEAARFWWQFAAGGGNRTAAFCLFLTHRRSAEFKDAAYWRAQSRRLPGRPVPPGPPVPAAPAPTLSALLPEAVRHDLIGQCHRGRHPSLPASLEAVINRLRVDGDDEDFGEVPQPGAGLADELSDR
ncbi:hypothetical protein [Streptomyces sp. NPDC093109]|uniref:hypothetical protein n=1 Tax=Streptomyces sp. NPDC093109 TaxID=3154977 RepID=UPI00345060E1